MLTATPTAGNNGYVLSSVPYSLVAPTGTPTVLAQNGTATTPLFGTTNLDDGYWAVTLPFNINLYGNSYTSANISVDGNIHFGTGLVAGFNTAFYNSSAALGAAIAGVYGDYDLRPYTGYNYFVRHFTNGSPGARKFVIEYNNVGFFVTGSTVPVTFATFQIVINESDNSIEVHSGRITNSNIQKIQGIQGTSSSQVLVVPGRNSIANWNMQSNDAFRFTPVTSTFSYEWNTVNNPNDLFTNAAGTTAYTGSSLQTVYAKPSASSTYNVKVTESATGCITAASVGVAINNSTPTIATPTATITNFCPSNTPGGTQ
jgi:hypothetical protein